MNVHEVAMTPRQQQVLTLMAAGKSNPEIAAAMDLKLETIKEHVQMILRRLGVANRTKAVVYALQAGMVPFPELPNRPVPVLSRRRGEVLDRLAEGKTNREIALEFGLKVSTVGEHVKAILEQLGLNNRTQVAAWAIQHGYLD